MSGTDIAYGATGLRVPMRCAVGCRLARKRRSSGTRALSRATSGTAIAYATTRMLCHVWYCCVVLRDARY
eukprot:66657-Rhodomonas_salina.2